MLALIQRMSINLIGRLIDISFRIEKRQNRSFFRLAKCSMVLPWL